MKQSAVLPIAFVVACHAQRGRYGTAVLSLAGIGAAGVAIVRALDAASHGAYAWMHFVVMPHTPLRLDQGLHHAWVTLLAPSTIVYLGLLAFLVWHVWRARPAAPPSPAEMLRSPELLLIGYCALSTVMGLWSASHIAANVNHYLDAGLAAAIVLGIVWNRAPADVQRRAASWALALFGVASALQLTRSARGEYFLWQGAGYYREVVRMIEQHAPPGATCLSTYPDLVVAAHRPYHFGDWYEYHDGRAPELRPVFAQAIRDYRYPVVVWARPTWSKGHPEYREIPIAVPAPKGLAPLHVFVREDAP
jgi:hypothetical protein